MLTPRLLIFLLACAAFGYDFSALKSQGYVSDFARVIDPQSKAGLEQYCARIEKTTGVEIALVTLGALHNEPIEDVANLLFRKWGVGKKKTDEGVLFLLAIRERRSRLELGYGLEPVITDGASGALLRAMRPALRENHYGDAFVLALRELGSRIEQAKGVKIEGGAPAPRVVSPGRDSDWTRGVLFFAMMGVMAALLVGVARRGRHRRRGGGMAMLPWLFLGSGSRAGLSSSHGGFGGYDSSDSFGGFGGGDSGGGGASSSW